MRLYLIRHAQPASIAYENLPPGIGLGELGIAQAKRIAYYLKDKEIGAVFCSDFMRVQATADIVLKDRQMEPRIAVHSDLRERNPSTESHASLVARVEAWMHEHFRILLNQPAMIVSHCGPLNMILGWLDAERNLLAYPCKDQFGCLTPIAGVWELEIEAEGLQSGKLITEFA